MFYSIDEQYEYTRFYAMHKYVDVLSILCTLTTGEFIHSFLISMPRRRQSQPKRKVKQRPEYNFNKGLRGKHLDPSMKGGIYIHTPFHPVSSSSGDYMILKVGYTEDTLYSRMSQCFYTDYPYGLYEIAYFQFDSLMKKEWMQANKAQIPQRRRGESQYFVEYYVEQTLHATLRREGFHIADHSGVKQSEWYQVKLEDLDDFINHVYSTIASCFLTVFTHHLFDSFIIPYILQSKKVPVMKSKNKGFRKYVAHLLVQLDPTIVYEDVYSETMTDLIEQIDETVDVEPSLKSEWKKKINTWYDSTKDSHAIAMTGMVMKAYWVVDLEEIRAITIRGNEKCLFRRVKLKYPRDSTHGIQQRTTRLLLPDRKNINDMLHSSMKAFGDREYSPVFCMIKYNIYQALHRNNPDRYKDPNSIPWNSLRGLYALTNVYPLRASNSKKSPPKPNPSHPSLQTPQRPPKKTGRFHDADISDDENESSSFTYMTKIGYAYGFSNDNSIVDNEKEMKTALDHINDARKEQEKLAESRMQTRQAARQAAKTLQKYIDVYNNHYQKHRQLIHAQPHHKGGFLARFDNCYRGDYVFGWMPLYFLVIDTSVSGIKQLLTRPYLKSLEAQVHEALRYALAYSITRKTGEWFAATSHEVKQAFSVAQTFLDNNNIPCTIVDMFPYSVPSHEHDCSTTYLPAELLSANLRTFERRYASFEPPAPGKDQTSIPGMDKSFLRPSQHIINLIKEANKDPLYKNKHNSKLIEQQDIHDIANVKLNKILPQELRKIEAYQERLITFLSKYSDMFASFHSMYPAIRIELNQNRELLQNHYNIIQNHLLKFDNALIKKGDKKHLYNNDGRQHSRLSLAYGRIQQSIYSFVKKHPPTGVTYKKMPIMNIPFIGEWIQQLIRDKLFDTLQPKPSNKTDIFIHHLLCHISKFQASNAGKKKLRHFLQNVTKNKSPNVTINSQYTTHETNFGALLAICFLCIMVSDYEGISQDYASIRDIVPHIRDILLDTLGFDIDESSMDELARKKQMKQMKKSTVHVSTSMKDIEMKRAKSFATMKAMFDDSEEDEMDDREDKQSTDEEDIDAVKVTQIHKKPSACSPHEVHTLRWNSNSCYIDSIIMYFSFRFHGKNHDSNHPFIAKMKTPLKKLINHIQTEESLKHIVNSLWFAEYMLPDETQLGELARMGAYGYANDVLSFILNKHINPSIRSTHAELVRSTKSVEDLITYETYNSFKDSMYSTLPGTEKKKIDVIRKNMNPYVIYLDSNSSSVLRKSSSAVPTEPVVLPCISVKPYLHHYTKHDKHNQTLTPYKHNSKNYVISMKNTDTKHPRITLYEYTPRDTVRFQPIFDDIQRNAIPRDSQWIKEIIDTYCSEITIHPVPGKNTQMILCDIQIGEMSSLMKRTKHDSIAMALLSKETDVTFHIKGILYKTGGHTTLYITNHTFWYYYDDISSTSNSIPCVGTYEEWFPYAIESWMRDRHTREHQITLIYERINI